MPENEQASKMVQIRNLIQDISSDRVAKANELIEAYHKKFEATLEPVVSVANSGEKLIEIEDYEKAQGNAAIKMEITSK